MQAQLKKISLDEAVMQQNRAFRADKLLGFQWIPNTNRYVYFADTFTKMMTANTKDSKASELITLTDINKELGTKLKNFAGVTFIDANTLLITDAANYYTYNVATKTGKLIQTTSEIGENPTFDANHANLAFTEKNNLYYYNSSKEKIAVTNETNEAIVSGQFIARNEFGINNGIFWSPKATFLAFYQKDQTDVADYPLLDINETPGKLENIKYPMIGQKSERPRVGIYNLATKKQLLLPQEAMLMII